MSQFLQMHREIGSVDKANHGCYHRHIQKRHVTGISKNGPLRATFGHVAAATVELLQM